MPIRRILSRLLNRQTQRSHPASNSAQSSPVTKIDDAQQEANPTVTTTRDTSASMDLILYGRPSCPYCARVDRVIEELGIEDKITRRLTNYGSEWRTDLRNRTGTTQVPCLFINGQPMFESLDIIAWMRNTFSE